MKKILLVLAGMSLMPNSFAAGVWVDLTDFDLWSNIHTDTNVRIGVAGDIANPSGCSGPDSYMVLSTLPQAIQQRIYSSLLTAKAAERPIKLRVEGCENSRPAVLHVILK